MASHGDDSEDDDDIGVGEEFQKQIDALKRACLLEVPLGNGGYISTLRNSPSGTSPPANEEDEDDEEDDDKFLQSLEKKFGFSSQVDSLFGKFLAQEKKLEVSEDEEEDDEEILRSVEQLYRGPELPKVLDTSARNEARSSVTRNEPLSPLATPGLEALAEGDEGDDVSPQQSCERESEPVGKAITSLLPGNWNDADVDVDLEFAVVSSPLPLQDDNSLNLASAEAGKSSGPGSAQIIADALKKNRHCQRTLMNILSQIEAKQRENTELQKRVRGLVDFEKHCKRRFAGFFTDQANPSVKLIAMRGASVQNKTSDAIDKLTSDAQGWGPSENPDVEVYRKLQQKVSFTTLSRRWSDEERRELAKGVRQQVYESLVRQMMEALSADNLDGEIGTLDDHINKISEKQLTPQEISNAVPGISWDEVARLYVVGRTPEECRTRWMNYEDSLINKSSWTKTEDKKLLSIAQQHNLCNWEEITRLLGTNRTPAECLTRYQRSLNASIMRSNWTPEEDNQLRAAVEELGESDWSAVAACLEGRNNSQCLMRWYKVLHPTKKKSGRWSLEEDKRLKWAVSVYGPKKWKQIAEHVPGRTDLQCRERWCNVLDPTIKLGEWTEEEDRSLEASVAKHGPHHWAAIANDLKIRTDNQCWRRWKLLHPEDQPAFQRTVHIRRTALAGNFQGRRKERPRLGPQDFISKVGDLEAYSKKSTVKRELKAKRRAEDPPERNDSAAQVHGSPSLQSPLCGDPRERRAARIQKRKLARASRPGNDGVQSSLPLPSAAVQTSNGLVRLPLAPPDVQTSNGVLNPVLNPSTNGLSSTQQEVGVGNFSEKEKSGKRRKRKEGPSLGLVGVSKRMRGEGTRSSRPCISHSLSASENLQCIGPEISSFVDLICSVKDYCKYSCLIGREKWPWFQSSCEANPVMMVQSRPEVNSMTSSGLLDTHPIEQVGCRNADGSEILGITGHEGRVESGGSLDVTELSAMSPDEPSPESGIFEESGRREGNGPETSKFSQDNVMGRARATQDGGSELRDSDSIDVQVTKVVCLGMETIQEGTEMINENAIDGGSACLLPEDSGLSPGQKDSFSKTLAAVTKKRLDGQIEGNPLDQGNGFLDNEDEEVASATRAILSWPFLHGVQELWSRDMSYQGTKVPKQTGENTVKKSVRDTSTFLSKVVKKPRSIRPSKTRETVLGEESL